MFDFSYVIQQGPTKKMKTPLYRSLSQIKPKKARGEEHEKVKEKNNNARAMPPH
jgi:hypothetical protein